MNRRLWSFAAGGALVCALAEWVNPAQFFHSCLYGFILWLCVSLGALAQLMTHHLTGGRWGFVVRRILEAALTPLPALAVIFFILFLGSPMWRQGHGYFQPAWVACRAVGCFAIWIALARTLRKRSLEQDRADMTSDFQPMREMRTISGPGLVLYFVTLSLVMADWVMELEPGWRSTMFPGIVIATQTLMALSGATVAAVYLLPREQREGELATVQAWHDLGKLLFAFVIFWAYVAFSQLLIIWSGNIPVESVWYLHRDKNGWQWLARAIGVVCFFAPAGVLLFQAPKKNRNTLAKVAAGIFISQAIWLFWVIVPAFSPAFHVSVMDILVPLALGAVWGSFFWRGWVAASPIPRNDPRLEGLGVTTGNQRTS